MINRRNNSQEIAAQAAEALKVIASAAETATKVVAQAASEATKISHDTNFADHDLVVQISEQIRGIKQDILDLNKNISDKTGDHENRIRTLEDRVKTWGGALLAFQFFTGLVLWYFRK